jgi:hypothetical protein
LKKSKERAKEVMTMFDGNCFLSLPPSFKTLPDFHIELLFVKNFSKLGKKQQQEGGRRK